MCLKLGGNGFPWEKIFLDLKYMEGDPGMPQVTQTLFFNPEPDPRKFSKPDLKRNHFPLNPPD